MNKTFEQHLQEIFMDNGEVGGMGITKDNCDDLFESWIESNIDIVMEEAQKYGTSSYTKGKEDFIEYIRPEVVKLGTVLAYSDINK